LRGKTPSAGIEVSEAILYADDSICTAIKDFKSGKISINTEDLKPEVVADLTGALVDDNGALISATENISTPVALGFRAMKPNGAYRMFWLYRVLFGVPAANVQTKADSITFSTPTIEGIIMRRNKTDCLGNHPWKAEIVEGTPGVSQATIAAWFEQVYEAVFTTEPVEVTP
jgi:phi13 family phage major tail protein